LKVILLFFFSADFLNAELILLVLSFVVKIAKFYLAHQFHYIEPIVKGFGEEGLRTFFRNLRRYLVLALPFSFTLDLRSLPLDAFFGITINHGAIT